jgi:hypothetical protein
MTVGSFVRSRLSTMSGGARTPFTTADQKSIATALKPKKSMFERRTSASVAPSRCATVSRPRTRCRS